MTDLERPDLSSLPSDVVAYIEALESQLEQAQAGESATSADVSEPPTTVNVITISQMGKAKRTPRHHYARQRRGGMGVFDLETVADDQPVVLSLADEGQRLLFFTNLGRVFRLAVDAIPETEVRGRGEPLSERFPLRQGERVVAALPDDGGVYVALLSERGWVRRIRSSHFAGSLIPGMTFHDPKEGGPLVAACWTRGSEQLLLATRQGQGVRFLETQVPDRSGCLGMRVAQDDVAVAISPASDESDIFLLSADGKGTIRQMSGFRANKAPGAGGKLLIKTDRLVGAQRVQPTDDLFIISELSKIIRFSAAEIPAKEGVVQGVNVMSLRADGTAALAVAQIERT